MKTYNRKTFFENKKCIENLNQFRQMVDDYLKNIKKDMFEIEPIENNKAANLRQKINLRTRHIQQIIIESGIVPILEYSPPPASGVFFQKNIDIISNIFKLERLQIPYTHIFDFIDQSIGIYENDRRASIIRTFNPIFWIKELLDFIVGIPFYFLKKSGFNSNLEEAFLAKIAKFITYLISLISGAWFILDKFLNF